ncbi:hypothetical protein NEDG_00749 [Nematocida displodere]|uniref:Uncharacterized protein n=1 Tax=Nematocida displodere TaxID=1805483 RepID=A0A177ED13_9MICR|nr:hypothetical protein NEDG_00749 [Nematocida displodere]
MILALSLTEKSEDASSTLATRSGLVKRRVADKKEASEKLHPRLAAKALPKTAAPLKPKAKQAKATEDPNIDNQMFLNSFLGEGASALDKKDETLKEFLKYAEELDIPKKVPEMLLATPSSYDTLLGSSMSTGKASSEKKRLTPGQASKKKPAAAKSDTGLLSSIDEKLNLLVEKFATLSDSLATKTLGEMGSSLTTPAAKSQPSKRVRHLVSQKKMLSGEKPRPRRFSLI